MVSWPRSFCYAADQESDPDVTALVRRLDGLPLALATAGSYLEQASISVSTYLRLYESSWAQIHQDDPGLETYEDRTLYSTWQISSERIQQQNELSARLLCLWCYFSNQDLWYELLCDGDTKQLPWMRNLTDSLPVFIKAMRLLCDFGLAESDSSLTSKSKPGGYSVHACVHSWTRHVLNKHWDNALAEFAVSAVSGHIPSQDTKEPWITQRRLLQHAERCVQYLPEFKSVLGQTGESLHDIADLLSDLDGNQAAEKLYLRALRGKEEAWGPKHTSTLSTVNNLGILYKNQDRMREAEEMYLRALRGYEEAWGPKHTSTLSTVNNLGNLYADQGRMREAEEMYLRALRGYEEAWGPKHTSTLDTVNNLGLLYSAQGRMREAEEMYLRALEGYKTVEGDHEADIRFLQEQLVTPRRNDRGGMSGHPEIALRGRAAEKAVNAVDLRDSTARMKDYVVSTLAKLRYPIA